VSASGGETVDDALAAAGTGVDPLQAGRGAVPAPAERSHLIREVTSLTLRLSERLHQDFARQAAEVGLTASQARVLLGLQPDEAIPMQALAARLGLDRSNLTAFVDKLEARGVIERRPDATDRRIKTLVVTDAGRHLRQQFWDRLMAEQAGPLAHLTCAQARALHDRLSDALVLPDRPADPAGA